MEPFEVTYKLVHWPDAKDKEHDIWLVRVSAEDGSYLPITNFGRVSMTKAEDCLGYTVQNK